MADIGRTKGLSDFFSKSAADGSPPASIERMLRAIRSHLGMDVAFVSEFAGGRRIFRHVDAVEGAPIRGGDSTPAEEGYCQRIVDGRLPGLIPDTAAIPEAMALPVTQTMPVGAHLSVPIKLSDGRIYGTFCCFSFAADLSLNQRDLQIMRVFADLAALQIDQDVKVRKDHEERIQRISRAIEEKRFSTVYQPIYQLGPPDRIVGLECLARFLDAPSRPPDQWFSEAAEVGLGAALDLAALRMATAGIAQLPKETYLAINLSPQALLDRQFRATLERLPLDRLVLEVTEHQAISAYTEVARALEPFRRQGLRVAVDDAGAGYASMRHILNLQPNLIKLDISLTRQIDSDPARRALASALIGFAREIGSEIIAEGVETAAELKTLRLLGVQKAQGYLLGRPMPFADAVQLSSPT